MANMQNNREIQEIVMLALREDIGNGDLTAQLIPAAQQSRATIIARQDAIVCGTELVNAVYQQLPTLLTVISTTLAPPLSPLPPFPLTAVTITWHIQDGAAVTAGQPLCTLSGQTRQLLSGERCALNFLQTLSSTATLTKTYATAIAGTKAQLLDTRKTLPGMRRVQKYAVTCGDGHNHRFGLYDAILIKENHIAACGSITKAVTTAKDLYPNITIEVEVTNLKELHEALMLPIDRIMLDNFDIATIKAAIAMRDNANNINAANLNEDISVRSIKNMSAREQYKSESGWKNAQDIENKNNKHIALEVSGGVTLENIRAIAETGVDYISVGAITKTVIPIELSMLFAK